MDLEQRVAELERRTTRYRNGLVMLVVGICAVAVVGATTDDGVIDGKYLLIRNKQGEIVVSAGADDAGDGLLYVSSRSGADLFYAGATADGDGLLTVMSKTGTDLIYAGADAAGHGMLRVISKMGGDLVYAGADVRGDGQLGVMSNTGKNLIIAGTNINGDGMLKVVLRISVKTATCFGVKVATYRSAATLAVEEWRGGHFESRSGRVRGGIPGLLS